MKRRLLALVALLAVVAAFAGAFNPGPRWRVAKAQRADGNVLFDGDPVPAADAEAMNDLLLGGTLLEWRGHGDLELVSPGHAWLALAPGTVVELPAPPPRWFGRSIRARLREGMLRFVAGPSFRGARLVVETPDRAVTADAGALLVAHEVASGTRVARGGPEVAAFAAGKQALLAR